MLDFRKGLINGTLNKALKRLHYPLKVMLTCVRWYVNESVWNQEGAIHPANMVPSVGRLQCNVAVGHHGIYLEVQR